MNVRIKWTALALALSLATAAWANPSGEPDRLQLIVEQQRELEQDLDGIEGLTKRQINLIRKSQQSVFAITEGKSRLDELTIDDKVKLENALERINAELVNTRTARDEQGKCHIEKKTGSKREIARCASVDERDRVRQGARAWMEKPKICSGPGCG